MIVVTVRTELAPIRMAFPRMGTVFVTTGIRIVTGGTESSPMRKDPLWNGIRIVPIGIPYLSIGTRFVSNDMMVVRTRTTSVPTRTIIVLVC